MKKIFNSIMAWFWIFLLSGHLFLVVGVYYFYQLDIVRTAYNLAIAIFFAINYINISNHKHFTMYLQLGAKNDELENLRFKIIHNEIELTNNNLEQINARLKQVKHKVSRNGV